VREWLESFALVGIHERLLQSLQLMSYTFGLPAPSEVPHCNRSQCDDFQLTPEQRQRVQRLTSMDQRLYEWAMARHHAQYQAMLRQFRLERSHQVDATPVFEAKLSAALNTWAQERRTGRMEREGTSAFEVVSADGFLAAHLNRDWRRYIQWIGPRPEATVRLA